MRDKQASILQQEIKVINMGLEKFAEDLRQVNTPVIHMDWRPPAGGDRHLIALLDKLSEEK